MKRESILVIGAGGQIGVELTAALRRIYGDFNVIAADLQIPPGTRDSAGPYQQLDVMNKSALASFVAKNHVTQIYLLAAMLSATGEKHPEKAWQLNMQSLLHVLDVAVEKKVSKVFWPSSIAVFGPGAPAKDCPQDAPLVPATVYGISKAAGENWCKYYWKKHGVDVRSIRYPGLISHLAKPGGGTTDYAVDIFHQALAKQSYTCYLRESSFLPMMYMPDAIRATIQLMDAPAMKLSVRTSYNLAAMTFSPAQLARSISRYIPDLVVGYAPDARQVIADSWPESIDDRPARHDWGWDHEYDLSATTRDMLLHLAQKEGVAGKRSLQLQPDVFF